MRATSLGTIRRFANTATDHRNCDICRSELIDTHRHVVEVKTRRILCACDLCSSSFSVQSNGRFRLIPQYVTRVALSFSDSQWARLGIPIGLAFFTVEKPSQGDAVIVRAVYPSPAGAVASSVDSDLWQSLIESRAGSLRLLPDVESLLVRRTEGKHECFIVPVDRCFELIGIVRRNWQGMSGGVDVHHAIDQFFHQIDESASRIDSSQRGSETS